MNFLEFCAWAQSVGWEITETYETAWVSADSVNRIKAKKPDQEITWEQGLDAVWRISYHRRKRVSAAPPPSWR